MTNLRELARQFRQIADLLDGLVGNVSKRSNENPTTALLIKQSLKTAAQPKTGKKVDYNGTHWTQQPKNKARVAALARARSLARRKS